MSEGGWNVGVECPKCRTRDESKDVATVRKCYYCGQWFRVESRFTAIYRTERTKPPAGCLQGPKHSWSETTFTIGGGFQTCILCSETRTVFDVIIEDLT